MLVEFEIPSGVDTIYVNYCIRNSDEENKNKLNLCYGTYKDYKKQNENNGNIVEQTIYQNRVLIGDNIYDKGTTVNDYYLDTSGIAQSYSGAKYKIFDVFPNCEMTMLIDCIPTYGWSGVGAIGFYSNGNIIGRVNTDTVIKDNICGYYTFTTPENCEQLYVPLQIRENDNWIGKISLCYGNINDLLFSAQQIKKEIENAVSNALNWNTKKWVVFGDSITEKNYRAETSYYDYIKEETNISVINKGSSSTGYKQVSSAGMTNAFYQRIASAISGVDFDVITIMGSINDIFGCTYDIGTATDTGTDTLGGCINTTLDNLYSVKPLAVVGLITPTPCKDYMPYNNERMEQYVNLIVEIAKRRSIPCLDLFPCSTLRPDNEEFRDEYYKEGDVLDTFGIHPNSKGHKRIYTMIREFLKQLLPSV